MLIEPLKPVHSKALFKVLKDDKVYKYLDQPTPQSEAAFKKWVKAVAAGGTDCGKEVWLNWVVKDDNTIVGYVQSTIYPDAKYADIAYVLGKNSWGLGLGYLATSKMIEEIKNQWELDHLLATTEEKNTRSINLLERLGFEKSEIKGSEVTYKRSF